MKRALAIGCLLLACSSAPRAEPAATPPVATTTEPSEPRRAAPSAEAMAAFAATDGQPPRDRARVACERLLGGARLVGPETERPTALSERAWRLVHEPSESYREGRRELVLFADRDGEIVEAHADALTGALETFALASLAAEASEPTCEAPTSCGCFRECVEVVRLGADGPDARYRVLGTEGGLGLHRAAQCYEGACARVCDAPGHCVDALSSVDETCTGSCVPAEAPFHCVRGPSGCERIAH